MVPVLQVELELVEDFESSQRAAGGFGHSGRRFGPALTLSAPVPGGVAERYCAVACETAGAGCVAAARGALGRGDCEWIECSSR